MLKSVGWTGHRNITVSHQENEKPSGFTSEMPTTHGICSFRMTAEQRLIEDVEQWMRYHDARNLSSHTYLPEIADDVYRSAFAFHEAARKFLEALEERND